MSMFALLGAVACGAASQGTESNEVMPPPTLDEVLRERVEAAGPPQSEWLADGVVTNAELEAAFLAAVQCAEEAGVGFEAEHYGAGDYSISRSGGSEAALHEGQDSLEECFEDHFDLIATVYARLYGPTEAELQRSYEIRIQCANEAGVEGDTVEEIRESLQATPIMISHCYDLQAEFIREIAMRRSDEAAVAASR